MVGQRENASCSRAGKVSQGQKRWLGDWGGWAGASRSWRNGPAGQRGEASRATCPRRIAAAGRASRRSSYGGDALSLSTHGAQRNCGELSARVAALMWTSAATIAFERRALPRLRSRFEPGEHGWASVAICLHTYLLSWESRDRRRAQSPPAPTSETFGKHMHAREIAACKAASLKERWRAKRVLRALQVDGARRLSQSKDTKYMRLRSTCTLYKDRSTRREGV